MNQKYFGVRGNRSKLAKFYTGTFAMSIGPVGLLLFYLTAKKYFHYFQKFRLFWKLQMN